MAVDYRSLTTLLILAWMVLVTGCGYYSVSGSLPGHIKTAAVPEFENNTVEPGLSQEITEVVEKAIFSDGSMKIAGEFQADALVQGIIVEVFDEADQFSSSESAKQFKIHIYADVQFFDRAKNKAIWEEKRMEGWAQYDASGSTSDEPKTREDAITEALQMLAELVIDKTVAGW